VRNGPGLASRHGSPPPAGRSRRHGGLPGPGRGYALRVSDWSEQGALPVDDAVVDDPPTEAEVRAAQEREYPEQAATRLGDDVRPGGGVVEQLADADQENESAPPAGADHG
jgi:hypothetical protein